MHSTLGLVAFRERRLDDAESELKKAIAQDPANPYLHIGLGATHYLQRDFQRARADMEAGLRLATEPETTDIALTNLAELDTLDGHWNDAEQKLNAAVQATPDSPAAYFELASLYDVTGRGADALAMEQTALSLDSEGQMQAGMAFAWPELQIFSDALAAQARGDYGSAAQLWTNLQNIDSGGTLHWSALAGIAQRHLSDLPPSAPEEPDENAPPDPAE
jgi:tetratricopeptide (TPR) repeat protein